MNAVWPRIRPLVFLLWVVAAARLALDAALKPELTHPAALVSVYYVSALAFVVIGVTRRWAYFGFKRLLAACALLGMLAWSVPDAVTYTVGQFQGWTHGRFRPEDPSVVAATGKDDATRSAPLQDTPAKKLAAGLGVGVLTGLAGFLWSLAWTSVLVGVPNTIVRRRSAAAP